MRLPAAMLLVSLLGSAGGALAAGAPGPPVSPEAALAASQAAIGTRVGEHELIDTDGRRVSLAQFRGKPLLVSLIYTSCYHTCSVFTRYLKGVVLAAREALGADAFAVITVGFDAGVDTPQRMRIYAREQGVDLDGWFFLSADQKTIDALTGELGFTYFASPKGFDHLAQVTVLDADGRVHRQVYGDRFEMPALVEPLKALVFRNDPFPSSVSAWMNNIRLFCTVYDAAAGRYRFDYSLLIGVVVGAACLLAIAVFVVHAWRRGSPGVGARERAGRDAPRGA
ncbi:MAG: SCO family protein [Gammaproteobacteria bacterium]|nr:SCO family protein [Gammaproteobacteria bacterium]